MKFLHSMIRISDLDKSIDFYCNILGLKEVRRKENSNGKFTLVFLSAPDGPDDCEIELTYNWGSTEEYSNGRNFGHLAFSVKNIYDYCSMLEGKGVEILRPPRDGHMAFVKSPDNISIEILQEGEGLPPHNDWQDRKNIGEW